MHRSTTGALLLAALAAPAALGAQEHAHTEHGPPLYTNLGDHHWAVTVADPTVQAYFDQGLRLYYAFNHQEAVRAFREAQRRDPECAMCWWGEAMARGPNINLPMDSASAVAAYAALERAMDLRAHASDKERALIVALAERYVPVPPADRQHLDRAFAEAMAEVARSYPEDLDVAVLHGEALMDLSPWDYWTEEGEPRPHVQVALAAFGRVLERNPDHPGACHFFIHAVEKLHPERAVPCAERLAALMPGAGHIVHMPGHIYIRVGRYHDAIEANRHAVHADETYIRDQRPGMGMYTAGYYPHNYDFLAFAATMIGRGDEAVDAAERVGSLIPSEMLGAPGMDFLQHWSVRPLQVRVRFGRWAELLSIPAPPEDLPHARALWHYARGRARAARGEIADARAELDLLREIAHSPALEGVRMEFNRSTDLLSIAEHVLAGWVASAAADHGEAVAELQAAVRAEDALLYGEPPEWTVPTRQDLGDVLLRAGRAPEAERAFREDLDRFPANGWSLYGLSVALDRQGRAREAEQVRAEHRRVWQDADVDAGSLIGR